MLILQTIAVAFAMFSALPVPQPVWNEKNMRCALCAFPFVGLVCAAAWGLCVSICERIGLPWIVRAAGLCVLPVLITGGIHLDGYADTCDALASCAGTARKQEILKDPHCGAFAVIRLCVYFVLYFSLCASLEPTPRALLCMGFGFILERALSGWAITAWPLAKNTGLAHTFAAAADKQTTRRVLGVLSAVLCAGMVLAGGWAGVAMVLAALLALWRYRTVAAKQFGGISGDLAGWFLQKAELFMLFALVICQYLGVTL